MKLSRVHFLFLFAWLPLCQAATLPGRLTGSDIDRLVEVIGLNSNARLLRSAEPYKSWPGFKVGFEVSVLNTHEINSLGNGNGSLAEVTFVPRIFFAKGLFLNVEILGNFFPVSTASSLSTFALALKWTALTEQDGPLSMAPFVAFTKVDGFGGYDGSNIELGAVFSKDYVKYKPFFGGGFVFARAQIINGLAFGRDTGADNSIHLFGGVEVELPVNLTFQADLMNLALSFSAFVGKKF